MTSSLSNAPSQSIVQHRNEERDQKESRIITLGLPTVASVSAATGWLGGAIIKSWGPKLVLDAEIARHGFFIGGFITGPIQNIIYAKYFSMAATYVQPATTLLLTAGFYGGKKVVALILDYSASRKELAERIGEYAPSKLLPPPEDKEIIASGNDLYDWGVDLDARPKIEDVSEEEAGQNK